MINFFDYGERVPDSQRVPEINSYHAMVERYRAITHDGFAQSIVRRARGGRVLDVGTGTGQVAIALSRSGFFRDVVGCDISEAMIEKARETAKRDGAADAVTFVVGDATRLPFVSHEFDVVVCHNLLHYFSKPLDVVREMKRVAKPRGKIFIRDILRPPVFLQPIVSSFFGIRLGQSLQRVYRDALRAALTPDAWASCYSEFDPREYEIKTFFITHRGIEPRNVSFGHSLILSPPSFFLRCAQKIYW